MRPRTLIAIARRDLSHELRGRRGYLLIGITLFLLLPITTAPKGGDGPQRRREWRPPTRTITVRGDIPERVLALDHIRPVPKNAYIDMMAEPGGPLVVRGQRIPPSLRNALDDGEPSVRFQRVWFNRSLPERSLFLGLISAAVLTGAVSESIGGERSRRTLETLLTAAITRWELVAGKWLAWAGYGAGSAMLCALFMVLTGRQEIGWWLLPLPTIAGSTVAVGMYVNRKVRDVVTGATVSLRWMPLVLSGTALLAWFVGNRIPLLGAAVPLGGALMAAGNMFEGALAPIVATVSTSLTTVLLLHGTARDLAQEVGEEDDGPNPFIVAAGATAIAALASWPALLAPMLWAPAGNYAVTESLNPASGVLAAGLGMLLLAAVRGLRSPYPRDEVGLHAPTRLDSWALGAFAGAVLALSASASGLVPLPETAALAEMRIRLAAASEPMWTGPVTALAVVLGQEMLFRGWIQKHAGPWLAILAWTLVMCPLDPVRGLLVGGVLSLVTYRCGGSLMPAFIARFVWAIPGSLGLLSPPLGLAVGVAGAAGLAWWTRPTPPDP